MLAPCLLRKVVLTVPLVFVVALLLTEPVRSDQEAGTAIPAESTYHPTVLSYSLYCSFNVAGLHITEACPNNSNYFGRLAYDFLKSQLDSIPVLVFSCIQGSPLFYTYLLPVAVLLIPEICYCSVPFLLYIPFIVLALSMPGITLFAFQRHSWDLFFSTDIVCLLHLSFLVMSAILKSVVFIKRDHNENAKKAHFVNT